ncbi:MAG: PspC domain-containing protein [Flavobacteriaceae bacterium]|nr:PspC domain-containing protein [Flavobacteriaceae bacterium]
MNKTISISLAGFSFMIEEHAYEKLNNYLQALRNSLEKDEADEVMYDIEIRIAEIFRENLDKREVVNSDDVEKVIAQIGTPEAIEGQSEENAEQEIPQEKTKKELFRDMKRGKIAGVCAGLAQYFGMDISLMRIIWILVFIFTVGFVSVVAYVILWIVLPEAETASDFLKMQGKPINFDSLKEAGQRVSSFYNENKSEIAKTGADIWKVARIVLGCIMAILAVKFLISLFLSLLVLLGGWDFQFLGMYEDLDEFNFIFDLNDETRYVFMAIVTIAILIPTIVFMALSTKLFSPKTKIRYWGFLVGFLTILLIILGVYFGLSVSKKQLIYSGNNVQEERVSINTQSNVLTLDLKRVEIPQNFRAYGDDIFSDKKKIYKEDYPDVYITRRNDVKQPYIMIRKKADGYNIPIGLSVPVEVSGNAVLLPNYISYSYEQRFRDYDVDYELVIPETMEIRDLSDGRVDIHGDEHGFYREEREYQPEPQVESDTISTVRKY